MDKKNKIIVSVYIIWAVIVFAITFVSKGLDSENITHMLIIFFFFAQLIAYPLIKLVSKLFSPKIGFLTIGLIFAAVVEGFYMISDPVFDSLKLTAGMSMGKMLGNFLIDLIFTIPVYIVIFLVIWYFINRYSYKLWEYLIIISLGQALGDGGFFFIASPFMLIFLPYVMINYHSMNLIPYILTKDSLKSQKNSWMKYIIPPSVIILIYIMFGILINIIGPLFALT
jgi:hypothetical protein